jgi:hypothetical protein
VTQVSVEEIPLDAARAVADAVLYEGYVLYPYRSSSTKNRMRWQFGVLFPPGCVVTDERPTVAGSVESWFQQTECLAEASADATVLVRLRFLQLQRRTVERYRADGTAEAVDHLTVGGADYVPFDEAVARDVDVTVELAERSAERTITHEVVGGEDVEELRAGGQPVGRVVRRRWPITARVRISADRVDAPFPLLRLRVRTENATDTPPMAAFNPAAGGRSDREIALCRALLATHTLMALRGGRFLSLLEPPAWAGGAVERCENVHTFPVLVGPSGRRDVVLSSPILLYDYPQVAPESPGDLYDAAEIDEILSLRALTLTDDEKRAARATDARSAAIVDRVDSLPPEVFQRLHGAIRSLAPGPTPDPEGAWATVAGVRISAGARVRLRPRRRGTDAHDMFLDGRMAEVHRVFVDVEGRRYLAVTLADDPGADVHESYGRFWYFAPEEVEPCPDGLDGVGP